MEERKRREGFVLNMTQERYLRCATIILQKNALEKM